LTETAASEATLAQTETKGDPALPDLLLPDLLLPGLTQPDLTLPDMTLPEQTLADQTLADTPEPAEPPDPDTIIAAELFSLLVAGAAMAARLPPTAFAVTQAAEGAMALLVSADPGAGHPVAGAGPGSMVLSGPLPSSPDAADNSPVQMQPQGLSPAGSDLPGPELQPPAVQAGPGLRPVAETLMPARVTLPEPIPGVSPVPQQTGAVPAVFAFRSEDRSGSSGPAGRDADPEGSAAAPPAPATAPGGAIPMPDPAAGTAPPADLPEIMLPPLHPGDAEIQFGSPHALVQTTAAHLPQGGGATFVPAPLAATLSDLLLRRTDGPVELTLSPEELGRVRLSLSADGDGLLVTVQVERGDTLDLLRRNSDLLLQEIRAQGFSGATFSFSGWTGERPEPGAHSGHDAGRPLLPSDPVSTAPPSSQSATAAAAGLDLRL
jgi:hypothetical protein